MLSKELCNLISQALWYFDLFNAGRNKMSDVLDDYQKKLMINFHFNGHQAGIHDYFKPATINLEPKASVASTSAVNL